MNYFTGIICLVFFCIKLFLVSCETEKPTGMKQGIYCECCSATVKEISKKLEKKTSDPWQVRVVEAMEDICKASSFRTYDYSPPTTVKGCKFLLENYDEDIENVFIQKDKDPEKKVCYELTKACEGVDRTKKEKEDMDVRVNNEKQEVNKEDDDGIQRMNVDINDPNSASRLAEQIKQQIAMQQTPGANDSDDDDDDEDEEDVDQMPEEEEDGDEGNERSVKKPKVNKEAEKKTEKQEKTDVKNEKPSTNKKTEL